MTLSEIYTQFVAFKAKRIKPSSLAAYVGLFEKHILPYFGDEDVSNGIDNKRINAFVENLLEKGLSKRSADGAKIALSSAMTYANTMWDIPIHAWKIDWPSKSITGDKKVKFFTKEECKKVFDLMENDPDPRLLGIVIMLTTGMRIGEIIGLRFSDVDFSEKTIHVQRTIQRVYLGGLDVDISSLELANARAPRTDKNSVIVINPPKTASSNRYVPLTKFVFKWIKKYSAVANDVDSYIITLKSFVIEARTYRNYYYNILKRLGLPMLNPHCMRHTVATQLLHNKVDVATIADILGHSSPSITLEVYSHTNESEKAKAVNNVFGKMFKR